MSILKEVTSSTKIPLLSRIRQRNKQFIKLEHPISLKDSRGRRGPRLRFADRGGGPATCAERKRRAAGRQGVAREVPADGAGQAARREMLDLAGLGARADLLPQCRG